MISKYIFPNEYRKDPCIYKPKPLVVDENGKVLEYIVDTFVDHHVEGNLPPDDYYREYIRFKVSKNTLEAYFGEMCGGLVFEKKDLLSVSKDIEFDAKYAVSRVKDWYEEKAYTESTV